MLKMSLKRKLLTLSVAIGTLSLSTVSITAERQYDNKKVKNVILMIPDGFSASYATSYRLYKGKESLLDPMLVGMHRTYSANSNVTDSAAAATAMATGVKTNNGRISISPEGKKLQTILEAAEAAGKATGLVVTAPITHATPAAFAAHVDSRAKQEDIAPQLLGNHVDVLLGGGKKYFPAPLLQGAKEKGYETVYNRDQLLSSGGTEKLIGLFAEDGMAPELDRWTTWQPSLAEMSEAAMKALSKDADGFFLMIEGSQIDWAGHAHDAAWAMKDAEAFEKAVEKVLKFAGQDEHTLVVIAGDHDTGGMSVGGYNMYAAHIEMLRNVKATGSFMASRLNTNRSNVKEVVKTYAGMNLTDNEAAYIQTAQRANIAMNEVISNRVLIGWTTFQHTGVDIPIYAFGPSSRLFYGLHNNTDFSPLIAQAMHIPFESSR